MGFQVAVAFLDEAMPQFVAAPCTGGSTHSLDELPVAFDPSKTRAGPAPLSHGGANPRIANSRRPDFSYRSFQLRINVARQAVRPRENECSLEGRAACGVFSAS